MRSALHAAATAATVLTLAACARGDALAPVVSRAVAIQGFVRVSLSVEPDAVGPPDTVVATLVYENLGWKPVQLTSGMGCLSFASVYLGEERIPFPATQYGCLAVVASRELDPGRPITVQWSLAIGGPDGLDVPAGSYRFVAQLNTHPFDLEHTFDVR